MMTPSPTGELPRLAHTVLAETVAAPQSQQAVSQGGPIMGGVPLPTSARTTVLPRVQVLGDGAQLVFDGKERFEKIKRLGEGGLGEVLGAMDHDIGRKVAIKRLHAHVRSPAALARFVDEIRTIGKLEHPNIIPIHDVGMDADGELYFVMKYVDGETLESVIEKLQAGDPQYHKHYTFERRVEIFRALLEALAFAHDKGIVHRDIKPANVMIGKFGEVLLMDWGVAKSVRSTPGEGGANLADSLPDVVTPATAQPPPPRATVRAFETQFGSLVGTPLYMSPEQASCKPADERSDVYSVCLLFMELLYLRHPLMTKTTLAEVLHAARTEELDLTDRHSPHQPPVPLELMYFLQRGLAKDPAKRLPSVRSMIDILDRRADGEIRVECPVTLAKAATMKSTRLIDRHPVVFMGLATSFLLFFAATVALAIRGLV